MSMVRGWALACGVAWALGAASLAHGAGAGVLEMRNGYFWDPVESGYFVPRGIAYQTWNPPVGANQSFEQLDYDLLEFKKMHANSVRCEFVWSQVQTGPQEWDWQRSDHLVATAEKLGLRLFVIIGFQYPPAWFPPEWRGINNLGLTPDVLACLSNNPSGSVTNCLPPPIYDHLFTNDFPAEVIAAALSSLTSSVPADIIGAMKEKVSPEYLPRMLTGFVSDVINYEDPNARRVYTNHIAKVVDRYKNSRAIGAWIMGNECAYFDLWESYTVYPVHRFIGYDPYSQAAFRAYLESLYGGDIAALNANWRTSYPTFDAVEMPREFPASRTQAQAHPDLIHWRQQSIGNFLAAGVRTARLFDPNHLLTYSMVGGIFNGMDANNTCEDAAAIVAACQAAGTPLDFWSINNYAWAALGNELRSGDFGISKYRDLIGLPVMISETGHSSTENFFPGAAPRQAKAIPGQLWESLISGVIGTHLFHWSDRNQFRGDFAREKGFGIVNEDRTPKEPVYSNVARMFRRMREIRIENLLGNSLDPARNVQLFWSAAGDLGWPRANQENAMLWGALKRLGLEPGLMDDAEFKRKAFTNAPALLLSRAWQLHPEDLDTIATEVIDAGIAVHANADLPGQFNAYLTPNPNWRSHMNALFGVDVANAVAAFDSGSVTDERALIRLFGAGAGAGPTTNVFQTWKIWHGVRPSSGHTLWWQTGLRDSQLNPPVPAVHVATAGRSKTALNTFGLGDSYGDGSRQYEVRYDLLRAIYRDHFGITPVIDIRGPGAKHVLPDYRVCRNGSVLLSLLNVDTAPAPITLSAPQLLSGRTVENLTSGGIIDRNSSGQLNFTLAGDDYLLLYAYASGPAPDGSLINPIPDKLWFEAAPLAVWPKGAPTNIVVAYDLQSEGLTLEATLEQTRPRPQVLARSGGVPVQGQGTQVLSLTVPDPDLNDPALLSSAEGGEYILRATLARATGVISETALPVRLLWGVRPDSDLPVPLAGATYRIPLSWQELPSYREGDWMPLDRALLWDALAANQQHYNVVLELRNSAGQTLASDLFPTSQGSGSHVFTVSVPSVAPEPLNWAAVVQSAPGTGSLDINDGFEGRERGEDRSPFHPWYGDHYSELGNAHILSQGVLVTPPESAGNQAAYLEVRNPPDPGTYSGFYLVRGSDTWALPANRQLWQAFTFSYDFRERNQRPCILELQLKDTFGNWISFARPYQPGAGGWDTVSASLAQFGRGSSPGVFDPASVHDWVLNVQMLEKDATYEGHFDNVVFTGPRSLRDDFENREPGEDYDRIAPWFAYGYDAPGHQDILLNQGVGLDERSEGSQAAFLVAWSRTDSGDFAGFGMAYQFGKPWALPSQSGLWSNYRLSFDFKERFGKACVLELQVTSPDTFDANGAPIKHAISFLKPYVPGSNQWDTVSATLDQFTQPEHFGAFDPAQVTGLVLNVQMLERDPTTNVVYVGWIDHIRFQAPEAVAPGESTYGLYLSANDSFRIGTIARQGDSLVISWVGRATLEMADAIEGPWTSAGFENSPATLNLQGSHRFYRLRR